MYSLADEVVLQNVVEYRGKRVTSCESAHIDLSSFPDDPSFKTPESESKDEKADKLAGDDLSKFCAWIKETALAGKVSEVKASDRLVATPVLISDYEGSQMRRMMKYVDPQGAKSMQLPMQKLQINPSHPLILKLAAMKNTEVAKIAVEQLFDNACVAAGLMDDTRTMLPRINKILDLLATASKKD